MLRMARESAGMHVGALAVSLKVPVRHLEALEAGQFDKLPDPIFIRALASSVCRQLRIDTKPVLAALPQAPALAPRVGEGINEPFLRPGMSNRTVLSRLALKPPILIATALALAALGILLQPWLMRFTESPDSATAVPAPQAPPDALVPDVLPPAGVAAPGPGGQGGTSGLVVEQVQPTFPGIGSPATLREPATSTSSPGRMP
jgi:cytoskeleton protein RodZ